MPKPNRSLPLFIVAITLVYAVCRYHVFKGVPWAQLPLYTVNKAMAWSALILLAWSVRGAVRERSTLAQQPLFRPLLSMLAWHVLASLALLAGGAYPALLEGGHLTLRAGLSLGLGAWGALSVGGLLRGDCSSDLIKVVAGTGAAHAGLLGITTWWAPRTWPGGMPPITMLSVLAGLTALAWSMRLAKTVQPPLVTEPIASELPGSRRAEPSLALRSS